MRILQIEKFYYPMGGAPKYALGLSSLLEKNGHSVIPFSTQSEKNCASPYSKYFPCGFDLGKLSQSSLKVKFHAASTILYSVEARNNMRALLSDEQVDVAHIHNIYHQISPSILPVIKKKKIPIVMTLHDYKLVSPNYSMFHHGVVHEDDVEWWYMHGVKNKCFKNSRTLSALVAVEMIFHHKIMRYYEKYVDLYLAPSAFIRDLFVRFGFPAEKIVHVPLFAESASAATVPGDYVAYVGRLEEEKGLRVLLDAAKKTPSLRYVVVGTGADERLLKERIQSELITNVSLLGFKTGAELQSIVQNARLLVAPSIWYENYPLSILEAKAAGKVVIGSSIGGIPELLPHDQLVQPGNPFALAEKITQWYSKTDEELQGRGDQTQKEVIQTNDPEIHVQRVLECYSKVIGR